MPKLAIIGLCLLALALVIAVTCIIVSRVRARILRNEDAAATEITLAGVIDEDTDMPEPDETEFRESLRRAHLGLFGEPADPQPLPFSDSTEAFDADARAVLSDVASNLIFVDVEPVLGRSYSEIPEDVPEAADPWLNDAEIRESTEIALATIAAISDAEAHIPDRSGDVLGDSWAKTQLRRINASLTDPMVADALIAHDPMMAFLLPVSADEPLPDFNESASAWASRNRIDEGHDIDGNSISWHTGLTRAMPTLRQRALESAESAR